MTNVSSVPHGSASGHSTLAATTQPSLMPPPPPPGRTGRTKSTVKRSPSAYLLFLANHRPEIKIAHPDWHQCDIIREIGTMWRGTSDEVRKMLLSIMLVKGQQLSCYARGSGLSGCGVTLLPSFFFFFLSFLSPLFSQSSSKGTSTVL